MNLNELLKLQLEFDQKHGFPVIFDDQYKKYEQLTKDLVGLFGEIGELSNIVKKINIKLDRPDVYKLDILKAESQLSEELIDSLIYIIRISAIIKIDLQTELIKKIKFNESRYASLEKK